MSNINTSYAQYYNKVEDRVGYVFRDRYRAEPIMTNSHLYNCISYIHNNPVKAGMVKTCGDYKYSSYNDYINNKIDQELLVELFGKKVGYMNIITVESDNCEFIEVDNEFGNPKKEKFEEIKKEYINENFNDSRNVYRVSKELKNRCGITNEKIYRFMRISKYKYYQIMKELNDE